MRLSDFYPRRLVHRLRAPFNWMSVGVRGVVQDEHGKVLLIRHTYLPGWHFPGGGVDPKETAQEAVLREVREETGIQITGKPELIGVYLNRALNQRDHVLVFHCRQWQRESEFLASHEIAEAGFFALDNLPNEISNGTSRRIAEIFDGVPPQADW